MDIEVIKAIASLPVEAILVFLLVRQQLQIEKLLAGMVQSEREHADRLVAIACGVRDNNNVRVYDPENHPAPG